MLRLSEAEVKSEFGKQLVEWLDCKYFWGGQKVLVVHDDEEWFAIRIYTSKHKYQISARNGTYLGCTASTRMSRPGEDWTRGNDLPDGEFSEETLARIFRSIVFYEAKEVVKGVKRMEDRAEEKQTKD